MYDQDDLHRRLAERDRLLSILFITGGKMLCIQSRTGPVRLVFLSGGITLRYLGGGQLLGEFFNGVENRRK